MKKKFKKNPFNGGSPKNFIVLVVLLVASIFGLTMLTDYARQTESVKYSKFIELVKSGSVKEVQVSGQDLYGVLKDDHTRFETTIPVNDPKIWDTLRENSVEYGISSSTNQFNLWQILLLLGLIGVPLVLWFMFRQSKGGSGGGGGNIFSLSKSRAKMFMPSTIKETFDSVAGVVEAKEELKDVVDFLKNPEKYKRIGARITRGALLVGEPGNGKTMLARAVAGEAQCPFFSISGSDFIEVFVGVGAARVRDLFAQARKHAPSIVFIDEIDAVGRHRGSGLGGGNDEREQTLNQLLAEMDGFEISKESVIVLAATNRPDVLDKALMRPGRFDRRVEVPYPDLKCREAILKVHAKKVNMESDVDLSKIARGTPGFSGADLANLVNESAIIASKKDQRKIGWGDFEEARDKVTLGKELKTVMLTEEDKKITAYHEAGHALIHLVLPEVLDPLHKVTIIPRGRSLGVTHSLPEKEKYNKTKNEIIAQIVSVLGGRASEELVFENVTTGAYSDFKMATQMAKEMVCYYGMSSSLGKAVYLPTEYGNSYSPQTAEKIDNEIRKILDECYDQATKILKENREKLDALAKELLEKETLYSTEIYELLGITPGKDFKFKS